MAALSLILLGCVTVCGLTPRRLPPDQCGPTYQRYCHAPGVKASFVKDKRINDSLSVDATLLQAQTDLAWTGLLRDFAIPNPDADSLLRLALDLSHTVYKLASKAHPHQGADSVLVDNNVVLVSYQEHTLCVFEPQTEDQTHFILKDFWFKMNTDNN